MQYLISPSFILLEESSCRAMNRTPDAQKKVLNHEVHDEDLDINKEMKEQKEKQKETIQEENKKMGEGEFRER